MDVREKFTAKGWLVWSICALFFLYDFLLRTVVGTFQHPIMYDLELSSVKFSVLSSTTFLLAYGLMQIPAGMIVDNFGLKKTLMAASSICALALLGFAFANSYYSAVFFRFLSAVGASCGFVCLAVSVFEWMPKGKSATLIGISQFVGTLGPMLAAGPIESLSGNAAFNWRSFFLVLSGVGILLLILVWCFVSNNRGHVGSYTILNKPESVTKRVRQLVFRVSPWMITLFSAFTYFTIEYLSENEGRLYIALKGYDNQFGSYLLSIAWLGYAIGCPALGFLSDIFKKRKPFMILASSACVIAIAGIIFSCNKTILTVSFLLLGIGGSGQSIGFTMIVEFFKSKYRGLGISLNNAVLAFVASANAPMLAMIIDQSRSGSTPHITDYTIAFYLLLSLISFGVLVPLFFIKETYCKSQAEFTMLKR